MKKNRTIIYPMIFLCVFFFVSFLTAPKGNYSTDETFSEVLDMVKSEDEFVIYFARDDCPECQKVDKLLKKNNGKLKKDIFRIETRTDPSQQILREFLKENGINKVPTFWSFDTKTVIKVQMILNQ